MKLECETSGIYRVWLLGHARSKKSKNYDKLEEIDGFGTFCYKWKCIIILPIIILLSR